VVFGGARESPTISKGGAGGGSTAFRRTDAQSLEIIAEVIEHNAVKDAGNFGKKQVLGNVGYKSGTALRRESA